jgi:DNA-binding transcriptional MocR family regulator
MQKGLLSYLQAGGLERHIRALRKQCEEVMLKYVSIIEENFPKGTVCRMPRGGTNLWIQLPKGLRADDLSALAQQNGITIAPASLFHAPAEMSGCFRINCLAVSKSKEAESAIGMLGRLAKKL